MATCRVVDSRAHARLVLESLAPLGRLAGGEDRETVNAFLVRSIATMPQTLFAMDFPFGLPVELDLGSWPQQLAFVNDGHIRHRPSAISTESHQDARTLGLRLVSRSEHLCGIKHVRRQTDVENATPFDCYHYRIIYQTYHGMRDVLYPIHRRSDTLVLPFNDHQTKPDADRLVVETCPSSTLKRLGLPHQRYKQSGGRAPDAVHRQTRRIQLRQLSQFADLSTHRRRVMMRDSGGDAIDAMIAAIGGWQAVSQAPHDQIAADPKYPIEGYVYA